MYSIDELKIRNSSKDMLITTDRKHRGYTVSLTNETILDRTYKTKFSVDNITFNCLAHYIYYEKCKLLELSSEICNEVATSYRSAFPIKADTDVLPWEDAFLDKYFDEISDARITHAFDWRQKCLPIAINGAILLGKQSTDFRTALLETKNNVISELSKSILWGIDCNSSLLSDIAHPELWGGENYYGQALMLARDYLRSEAKFGIKSLLKSRKGLSS